MAYEQSYFDSIAAPIARTFTQREYGTTEAPPRVFTLRPKYIENDEAHDHAWYLSHLHCALVHTDRVMAFRGFMLACKMSNAAVGPGEHDALTAAQNRLEQWLESGPRALAEAARNAIELDE